MYIIAKLSKNLFQVLLGGDVQFDLFVWSDKYGLFQARKNQLAKMRVKLVADSTGQSNLFRENARIIYILHQSTYRYEAQQLVGQHTELKKQKHAESK